MCGITGYMQTSKRFSKDVLKKITNTISHRGPDGKGFWFSHDMDIGLGHHRLSIIDLSSDGHQPMHYLGRYTIVFNGEIYNYIELKEELKKNGYLFHSKTDTEVILALYDQKKEDCLLYLDGMFAFAIWDNVEKELFCARDRFGEKPFYYHYEKGSHFVFASEIKCFWTAGIDKTVSDEMAFCFAIEGLTVNPNNLGETFYRGIWQLEASHYLKVDRFANIKKKRYWEVSTTTTFEGTEESAALIFYDLLAKSIERRLRSDVPVGSSLSGGIDSSAIVMIIDKLKEKEQIQKTFSARFKNFAKDEGEYINEIIQHSNIKSFTIWPDALNMFDDLQKVYYHQDEPFGSASIFVQWKVMELAKQHNVVVLLDGQGADEILAGYPLFFNNYFWQLYKENKKKFKNELNEFEKTHERKWRFSIKDQLQMAIPKTYGIVTDMKRSLLPYSTWDKKKLYQKDFIVEGSKFYFPNTRLSLKEDLKYSISVNSLPALLRYADRNSMAHGREVRLPYLNDKLVAFVLSLPENYIIKNGWTKYIMRKALEPILPLRITWRKDKIGYEPPQKTWLQTTGMKQLINENKLKLQRLRIINENNCSLTDTEQWRIIMLGLLY